MKHIAVVEMNVSRNAVSFPKIHPDGAYELTWELPNGSSVKLTFENADPINDMYGKLGKLEAAQHAGGTDARTMVAS